MRVNPDHVLQLIGKDQYEEEEALGSRLDSDRLKPGSKYIARLIREPRPRPERRLQPVEFNVFAEDILVRIDERAQHRKRFFTIPSHPDIYEYDAKVTQIDETGEAVGEPSAVALSFGGLIYNTGHIIVASQVGMIRLHSKLGYFPGSDGPRASDIVDIPASRELDSPVTLAA